MRTLTYTRGFNRTQFSPGEPTSNPGTLPLGEPRVTTTFFDAVVGVTSMEVIDTGVSADAAICMDQRGDATCRELDDLGGANVQLYLPNGRRTTAHVIEAGADAMVRGESGLEEDSGAGPHPGSNPVDSTHWRSWPLTLHTEVSRRRVHWPVRYEPAATNLARPPAAGTATHLSCAGGAGVSAAGH